MHQWGVLLMDRPQEKKTYFIHTSTRTKERPWGQANFGHTYI